MGGGLGAWTAPVTAASGWAVAALLGINGAVGAPGYLLLVSALLGVGLYAAAHGIDLREARDHWRTVLLAVTIGVLAKVALIALVVVLCFGDPRMWFLAVAVAQIDPLSVAAVRSRTRLSPAGGSLLAAWASFDDPVTVLLTVYLAGFALPGSGPLNTGLTGFAVDLALNAALAGTGYLLWSAYQRSRDRRWGQAVIAVCATAVFVVAVWQSLLLSLAVIGLFARPQIERVLERTVAVALFVAAFSIGMVLSLDGSVLLVGVVLGVSAFFAQALVALLLPARGLSSSDRWGLALAQQNGLTAIVLALLLEPVYPGAAGTIACAVLVVNLVHAVANHPVWHRLRQAAMLFLLSVSGRWAEDGPGPAVSLARASLPKRRPAPGGRNR